ncbi:FecR family protein [Chitinophaga sp. CF118]|uniref:FecR family protein n=1 Tax=Chitinophaga sp. CF118 TaxID=1884367 RepID=UPI0008EF814A|nr:FecR family protein [Chitinophaga sp. CF118]SFE06118.1 FecR family protein [Chitinophaga sp. CF118]
MSTSTLKTLLEKYFNGTVTAEEKTVLQDLLAQSAHNADLDAALKDLWDNFTPDTSILPERADELFATIVEKKSVPMRQRVWWPAAAIITILLMAGGAKLLFQKSGPSIETATYKNDVPPGGNHAVLTLADGKKITLDSAGNGALGKQGNTVILKLNNGQLAYQAERDAPKQMSYNMISTPRGGQFQVVLPDGTKVWMNAASSLRFPTAFIGNNRQVELSGEAYFEVTKDETKPFIVNVNRMKVAVLGTHFNIMSYPDEKNIETTLLEGAVNVSGNGYSQQLKPGQQTQLSPNGNLKLLTDPDIESALAWKNGYFQFNKADLQSVMRQLARWYDVEVIYKDQVPDFMFVGQLDKNENLSVILRILERSQVHFNIDGKKITVMP